MGFTFKNVLLVLSVSLLSLLALEALTRLVLDDGMLYELEMWKYAREVKVRDMRPEFGHRHRLNAEAKLMGVTIRTNSRGFRSPEIAEKAEDNVARIAFVGDSIELGWGVTENETFPIRSSPACARPATRSRVSISALETTTPRRSWRCSARPVRV
jgi:hypothetical protein